MQIDHTLVNILIISATSFFLGIILFWLLYRIKLNRLLQENTQTLNIQNDSERKILELELENLENELDLLREQLSDKEVLFQKKQDELSKMNELRAIYATRAAQISDYKEALEKSSVESQQLRDEAYQYEKQLSEVQIKSEEKLKAAHVIIENLEQSKQQLLEQFEYLGNKIFSQNSQELKQANHQEISHLLNPFKDQFTEFKRKVEELHELESRDRVSLANQVNQLSTLNQQISEDTINLTRALKGDVKFQGNWGEMVLENLLESSGLRKELEYQIQPTYRGEDNHLLRPDVVINLPDNKTVIVDSKVSLKSYAQYVASIDKKEQKSALKNHVQSLKNHIKILSDKDYSAISELHSLDFVLLFVPIEQALMLAINEEPDMVFSAFQKRIILVSTTTLLATVRTIENFWRYDKQQSNAEEIAKRAGDMLDKFSLFVEELETIGIQLDRAKSSYNTAHNRLISGNGNLISRAKVIQELGVKGKKEL
ncbi:MAG: DNA recombination protein RmuC [gamma proteobacterium symbiont of Bathyaustriella thionipta]|nr:DNA recombination protein RmuC [gamma proteobacterium symbiont of Bathyaustriella thionipta]MCU7950142.1 DNA recombination protein RmuC [gamma proteobacterium symbiont of Bathyaustriella thionipta]MCU7952268.1 DNA recombination protein RmuC [gamma proteobacterium symbiont of Bathyaustriella thionipta]MCU7956946.1 DNA recombination protein RmuC [gamma proteobacterium symbiont of Bathyaustriella thionipta]MCU7965801.1 DNA recombination protein RmuC [gamma proteobacterium symbiont of Bathyaustr